MEKEKIERIKEIIERGGWNSPTAFAKDIDFSPSNLSKILRGVRKVPSNLIQKIANHTNFNPQWIETGEGPMMVTELTPMEPADLEEYDTTTSGTKFYKRADGQLVMKVPIVPVAALGSPADEYAELTEVEDETVTITVDEVHHGKYIAFRVDGDSMDDGRRESFERGDVVVVRELGRDKWLPKLRYNKWPFWVVCFGNNVRLKEIVAHEGENITLHSLNPSPEYTDFTLNLGEVSRLFNVVRKVPKDVKFG